MANPQVRGEPSDSFHPCFHDTVRTSHGRMHLPVAGPCNISCGYCDRRYDCVNESRPGVTSRLMSPAEAVEHAAEVLQRAPYITVAGIAGPGDPLADPAATLATFTLLKSRFPYLAGCVATNGLALLEHVGDLWDAGVRFVTVTVNAVTPSVGAGIYGSVVWKGRRLTGEEGAALLSGRQLEGISALKRRGFLVKVNMVLVPGHNDRHVTEVARTVGRLGADRMNLIGMLPVRGTALGSIPAPASALLGRLRLEASRYLPQMAHCSRCRADDAGLLGGPSMAKGEPVPARLRCGSSFSIG